MNLEGAIQEIVNNTTNSNYALGSVVQELQSSRIHSRAQEMNRAIDFYSTKEKSKENKVVDENSFLLLSYGSIQSYSNLFNVGDYVQTIAVQNALELLYGNDLKYNFYDRDYLGYKKSENVIPCVMQGWFSHSYTFLPNKSEILPIFVGTHFIKYAQDFLMLFRATVGSDYFDDIEIGCRDKYTFDFCQKQNLKSYFSRCLSLTLPKRKEGKYDKVFLVNVKEEFLQYIPLDILKDSESINQRWAQHNNIAWESILEQTHGLLERYRDEARLVITDALHCAAPCVAMGIPVILIKDSEEQSTRFSALDGILNIYTLDDFKNNRVDFMVEALDIEELKEAMLINLDLSIKKARGGGGRLNEKMLNEVRIKIANFNILK